MVCSTEVYQWFKELSPFNRIDFLCSIMQLCLPNELRFIGTLLDDMNNKDYANLREAEDRSNSPNEFRQYPIMPFTEEIVRKLCLSLSLLKSTNQKVGQIIYEILKIHFNHANQCVKLKDQFSNEILLLYALASYHPAFTFENRFKIGKQFKLLQSIYEDSSEEFSNNNNSCYKDINKNNYLHINIKSVTIEHSDADIILEISSNNTQNLNVEKVTTFSKIIELFKESKNCHSDLFSTLQLEISNITKNGNFNVNNIRCICQKIIKFLNLNSDEDNSFINKFFMQLPMLHKETKSSSQVEMTDSISSGVFVDNNDEISSKHNFKIFNQNDSAQTNCFTDLKNEALIKDSLNKNVKFNNNEKSEIIFKENMYSDSDKDLSNQNLTETNYFHDSSIKKQETIDSTPSEMSDSILNNSDGSHFQDVNPIQVHYYLPPYSFIPAMKSSSSSQFALYSNNNNSNNNNSIEHSHPGNNSNKITRPSIPEQFVLAQYPNFLGSFNSRVNSYVPMFCSINQSAMNFIPINEMHYEHFFPHRMFSVTAATNIIPPTSPAVPGINKLSSTSSTPPRLQSNYHKSSSSSQYSTNFSGS